MESLQSPRGRAGRSNSVAPVARSKQKIDRLVEQVQAIRLAQSDAQRQIVTQSNTRSAFRGSFPIDHYDPGMELPIDRAGHTALLLHEIMSMAAKPEQVTSYCQRALNFYLLAYEISFAHAKAIFSNMSKEDKEDTLDEELLHRAHLDHIFDRILANQKQAKAPGKGKKGRGKKKQPSKPIIPVFRVKKLISPVACPIVVHDVKLNPPAPLNFVIHPHSPIRSQEYKVQFKQQAKLIIEQMLSEKQIEPSSDDTADLAPVIIVHRNSKYRLVNDFSNINRFIPVPKTSFHSVKKVFRAMPQGVYITKIDLKNGY
jgi:hypothetical protein